MTANTAAEHKALAQRHRKEATATGREGLGNYQRAHDAAARAHMIAAVTIDQHGQDSPEARKASDAANYATDEQAPPFA